MERNGVGTKLRLNGFVELNLVPREETFQFLETSKLKLAISRQTLNGGAKIDMGVGMFKAQSFDCRRTAQYETYDPPPIPEPNPNRTECDLSNDEWAGAQTPDAEGFIAALPAIAADVRPAGRWNASYVEEIEDLSEHEGVPFPELSRDPARRAVMQKMEENGVGNEPRLKAMFPKQAETILDAVAVIFEEHADAVSGFPTRAVPACTHALPAHWPFRSLPWRAGTASRPPRKHAQPRVVSSIPPPPPPPRPTPRPR